MKDQSNQLVPDDELYQYRKLHDNYMAGVYEYPVSPKQAYELSMHDQISSEIFELLEQRERYLKTGNLYEIGEKFSGYIDAIRKGKIKPGSSNEQESDKEMRVLAESVIKQNIEYEKTYLSGLHIKQAYDYADVLGRYAKYHNTNYEKAKEKIYSNIAGIDFTKYIGKEVELSELSTYAVGGKSHQEIAQKFDLPAFDGSMSLEQYQKLVVQKITLQKISKGSPAMFSEIVSDYAHGQISENTAQNIKYFKETCVSEAKNQYGDESTIIDMAVRSAALECREKGKFPKANEEAYQKAVDQLYSFKTMGSHDALQSTVNLSSVLAPDEASLAQRGLPLDVQEMMKGHSKPSLINQKTNPVHEKDFLYQQRKTPFGRHFSEEQIKKVDSFQASRSKGVYATEVTRPVPVHKEVSYQVDTLSGQQRHAGLYSIPRQTVEIVHNDHSNNKKDVLYHENKHRENHQSGAYEYPVSPEQAYKINIHDEISAHMTSLLAKREHYIQTGDMTVFDNSPDCEFYLRALESGEINPKSTYQEDFDKEMSFIVNGTMRDWSDKYAEAYHSQSMNSAVYYGDISGQYAKYYDTNYAHSKKIMYTIGGVDFTQYMDKDIKLSERAKQDIEKVHKYYDLQSSEDRYLADQNVKTHPVEEKEPVYRKWQNKDGERVSDVLSQRVIDFGNNEAIMKPTKTYAQENLQTENCVSSKIKKDSQKAKTLFENIKGIFKNSRENTDSQQVAEAISQEEIFAAKIRERMALRDH